MPCPYPSARRAPTRPRAVPLPVRAPCPYPSARRARQRAPPPPAAPPPRAGPPRAPPPRGPAGGGGGRRRACKQSFFRGPLVSRPRDSISGDARKDLIGRLGPHEGLGLPIGQGEVVFDGRIDNPRDAQFVSCISETGHQQAAKKLSLQARLRPPRGGRAPA